MRYCISEAHQSINQSTDWSTNHPINQSTDQMGDRSTNSLSYKRSIDLCVAWFVHQSALTCFQRANQVSGSCNPRKSHTGGSSPGRQGRSPTCPPTWWRGGGSRPCCPWGSALGPGRNCLSGPCHGRTCGQFGVVKVWGWRRKQIALVGEEVKRRPTNANKPATKQKKKKKKKKEREKGKQTNN